MSSAEVVIGTLSVNDDPQTYTNIRASIVHWHNHETVKYTQKTKAVLTLVPLALDIPCLCK